jgi:hypothetical protein
VALSDGTEDLPHVSADTDGEEDGEEETERRRSEESHTSKVAIK